MLAVDDEPLLRAALEVEPIDAGASNPLRGSHADERSPPRTQLLHAGRNNVR